MRMVLLLLLLLTAVAVAQELPRAKPGDVGLDPKKLAAVDAAIQKYVDDKHVSGSVTIIMRRGKVAYFAAHGLRRVDGKKPMQLDTMFRIYSMTKPVTSVAAMLLVEAGKLKLDDPVAKYLPQLKGLLVDGKVARAMTVRDLMRHTSGFTYGFFGNTEVDQKVRAARVLSGTLAELPGKLAKLPLLCEPGTRWVYSVSTDVLGRVIEVVSGKTLDVFFRERIFSPLKMKDTGFFVPEAKRDRLAANYQPGLRAIPDGKFLRPPTFLSGGGGLVSTAKDYALFCLMLANKGKGVLKSESVAEMTRNQLPDALVPIGFGAARMEGVGFGLGFSVRIASGEYGWGGAASTTFWIAPKQELVFINMIQRMPMWSVLSMQLRPMVYAAVTPR